MELRSSFEHAAWPAIATGPAADLLALQRQFDATQWWAPEKLRFHQFRQLRLLLTYAARQIPFYVQRMRDAGIDPDKEITAEAWSRLPVLTRKDLQTQGDKLNARSVPKAHGSMTTATSGGSSGVPVRVRKTALSNLIWTAIQIREEIWHREETNVRIARIRRVRDPDFTPAQNAQMLTPRGFVLPSWGAPMNLLWDTGEVALMDDRVPIPDQIAFMQRLPPAYLYCFPANLRLLLAHCRENNIRIPSLRAVWTLSEVVDDALRDLCSEIFNCRIVHNYTSAEGGYMALQCPEHVHFHVQAEATMLEVLHPDGSACQPGEIGRVVITPLHNFATPLLRYEIGDEAEVGAPCPCGRGLPVLRRIVGREFDYLTFPDGTKRRVDTGYYRISAIPAVREFQIAQRALDRIEALLVLARPLTETETATVRDVLKQEFGDSFHFDIGIRDHIVRTEAGKLRAFISDLPPVT